MVQRKKPEWWSWVGLKNIKKDRPKRKKVIRLYKTRQGREKNWQPLNKKMEDDREARHIKELDTRFARYIRRRDRNKDCITAWVSTCSHKIENNCHFISRWRYSHRWEERNCHWGCVSCNKYHQEEHKSEYMLVMIEKHWSGYIRDQINKRHKKKPSLEWMKEKIAHYKSLLLKNK